MSAFDDWSEEYSFEDRIRDEAERGVWKTWKGEEIPINGMSREHLRNTINFLENKGRGFEPWVHRMKSELEFREYIDKIVRGEL